MLIRKINTKQSTDGEFFPAINIKYTCPKCGNTKINFDKNSNGNPNIVFASDNTAIAISLYCLDCTTFFNQIIEIK